MNNPLEPVLYVSLSNVSALAEVKAEEGDHVHLIGYRIRNSEKIRCGIVGEIFNVHRSGTAKFSEQLGKRLNNVLNAMPSEKAKSFVFLDAFLSSILRDGAASVNDYLYSRTVTQLLFEKIPAVQAIWYSGVAQENAINLAIKPEVADKLFEVVGTTVVRINKIYDFGVYDFSIVRNAKGYDHQYRTMIWDS